MAVFDTGERLIPDRFGRAYLDNRNMFSV